MRIAAEPSARAGAACHTQFQRCYMRRTGGGDVVSDVCTVTVTAEAEPTGVRGVCRSCVVVVARSGDPNRRRRSWARRSTLRAAPIEGRESSGHTGAHTAARSAAWRLPPRCVERSPREGCPAAAAARRVLQRELRRSVAQEQCLLSLTAPCSIVAYAPAAASKRPSRRSIAAPTRKSFAPRFGPFSSRYANAACCSIIALAIMNRNLRTADWYDVVLGALSHRPHATRPHSDTRNWCTHCNSCGKGAVEMHF